LRANFSVNNFPALQSDHANFDLIDDSLLSVSNITSTIPTIVKLAELNSEKQFTATGLFTFIVIFTILKSLYSNVKLEGES